MKYLNLDNTFTPFGESIKFDKFTFSGGEPHIRINTELSNTDNITITTRVRNFNDLGFLLVATDALKRIGVESINLFLPYFPGARQDRIMQTGEALTVKIYAQIINAQLYKQVTILDPHSDVTSALINNVIVKSTDSFVKEAISDIDNYLLVAPDAGAVKRVFNAAKVLKNSNVIDCTKMRETLTGNITGLRVNSGDLSNQTCVIIDDICDGGRTFIELAKELKKKRAGKLILIVTHGIFSKGYDELKKYYHKIICTNSFSDINDKNITQIRLNSNLLNK